MKPFDPRLLRQSAAVRGIVGFGVLWALLQTAGIVLFAWSATALISGWFTDGSTSMLALGGILLGALLRALAVWASARTAARGAARAKAQLRDRALTAIVDFGPTALAGRSRSEVTLLLGRGLDALDDYFGSYLPQLHLAAISTPLLWLAILSQDAASAITIAVVLPLIPVFMVLIGLATRSVQSAQWASLQALGRQFLDLVDGLATLKIFRREHAQARGIAEVGEDYRRRTMRVLRLSFLSGFTLELAATLSVALVAVLIGTRLVAGELSLTVGLFVLLLVPDVFAPLRQVGASFHAAADGLTAANELFALIAAAQPQPQASRHTGPSLWLENFSVWRGPNRIIGGFNAEFTPGLHAIVGESGAGKSTLLAGILGFARTDGQILGVGADRDQVAWVPQRPSLSAGTVAANVALGDSKPDLTLVQRALTNAAAADIDPHLTLGAGGAGLSGGQAQRVSVARAFYRLERQPQIRTLLLDEPSSALDGESQRQLALELRRRADDGLTVLVVSHRDGLIEQADRIWPIGGES